VIDPPIAPAARHSKPNNALLTGFMFALLDDCHLTTPIGVSKTFFMPSVKQKLHRSVQS
jgi:hypothetical protein